MRACCIIWTTTSRAKKGSSCCSTWRRVTPNYNSDLTRTIPVSGRFNRRQKQVYRAVLRVLRGAIQGAMPGKLPKDWQKEAEALMEKELVDLGLLELSDIKKAGSR